MQHGGKRNGAGRKTGSATQKTREVADRESGNGITPLEVLLQAMREHYHAGRLNEAAAVAKDAAPYMHPRLTSSQIQARVESETSQVVEFIVTSREQADQAIAALADASGVSRQ